MKAFGEMFRMPSDGNIFFNKQQGIPLFRPQVYNILVFIVLHCMFSEQSYYLKFKSFAAVNCIFIQLKRVAQTTNRVFLDSVNIGCDLSESNSYICSLIFVS